MRRLAGLLGILLLGLAATSRAGGDAASWVRAGIEAYQSALEIPERDARLAGFRRAQQLFSAAIEQGIENAELYTNLGNAALQAERLGDAVLAYRRALRLDPDHPRALQNLAHARSLLPEWVPRPEPGGLLDSFFFWHRSLAPLERARAAALAFVLASLALALWMRTGHAAWRSAALLPGLAWAALLGSWLLDPSARERDQAVITAEEVVARAADSARAPALFPEPLPSGVEVRIVTERAPFSRVRLANGHEVWVRSSALAPVAGAARSDPQRVGQTERW